MLQPQTVNSGAQCAYDDAPLRPFHLRVAIASFGGVFSDGFGLGIIGSYVWRAFENTKGRPLTIAQQTDRFGQENPR